MAFPPQFLEEIRNRVSLSDVIGRRTKLVKKGREFSGLCPFHNEKTPSFTVNEEKGFYHCFGCGANGDLIEFIKQTEGVGFPEAVERLASIAGLQMPIERPEDQARRQKAATLHDAMELAAKWFSSQLLAQSGQTARQYLAKRQVSDEAIEKFRIGAAPNSRTALKEALLARGVNEETMLEGGLIIQPDDGRPSYDRFRDRLMFPIADRRGRVIAFGGRALGDAPAKYLNSPETPLFHKGHVLYNMAMARQRAFEVGNVIVAEGYMDVIALAEAGFPQTVAPLGTAITENQLNVLWGMAAEPIMCLDGDEAGWAAALRVAERALPILRPGFSLRFALLPQGVDPDDLIRDKGKAAMADTLDNAIPLSEILWRKEVGDRKFDTPERKAAFEKSIYSLCDQISDSTVQSHYKTYFRERLWATFQPPKKSEKFSERRGATRNRFGRFANQATDSRFLTTSRLTKGSFSNNGRREELIVLAVINHPEILENHFDEFDRIKLHSPQLDRLRRSIIDIVAVESSLDYAGMAHHLAKRKLSAQVDRLKTAMAGSIEWYIAQDAALEDAVSGWRHILSRQKREALMQELKAAEDQLSENMTAENNERLKLVQKALLDAEGNEADLDGFGLASGRKNNF
jgi:DNA primase